MKETTTTQTIQLQSYGHAPATEAENLEPGDVTIWNFGSTETITKKLKETAKTVTFEIVSDSSGTTHQRRFNKNRLVAVQGLELV